MTCMSKSIESQIYYVIKNLFLVDPRDIASDPSYLDRVQQLLNTPSLQRPLDGLELSLIHSPDTDSVLDGDRSWEQYLPVYD